MPKALAVVHFFYSDQVDTLLNLLQNISIEYDLYCTIGNDKKRTEITNKILNFRKDAKIIDVANVGYDVWPFVYILNNTDLDAYDYIIKLHTKRDLSARQVCDLGNGFWICPGSYWRESLYAFLATKYNFEKCLDALKRQDVGMCTRFNLIHNAPNYDGVMDFAKQNWPQYVPNLDVFSFVAGTMFIAKAAPFQLLKNMHLSEYLFDEPTTNHGTQLAHVIERTIGAIFYECGMKIIDPFTSDAYQKYIKKRYKHLKQRRKIIDWLIFWCFVSKYRHHIKSTLFERFYYGPLNDIIEQDCKNISYKTKI